MTHQHLAYLFLAITLLIGLSGTGLVVKFWKRDALVLLIAVAGTVTLLLVFAIWNIVA